MKTMHTNNEVFQPANTHFTFLQIHVKTDERPPTVFKCIWGWERVISEFSSTLFLFSPYKGGYSLRLCINFLFFFN